MAFSNSNPVPDGVAGHGASVIFGPPTTDGLGGLRYLEKTDAIRRQQEARAQAAAQKHVEAQQKEMLAQVRLKSDTGVHYGPALLQKRQQVYDGFEKIATDSSRPWAQRSWDIQRGVDDYNAELAAGKQNDKLIGDEVQRHHSDTRYDAAATTQLLTDTLYRKNEDGSLVVGADGKPELVPAREWDPRAAAAAISTGNKHLVGSQVYGQFLDKLPENSITYSREALPSQRGYRNVAKSNIFELTPEGQLRRDPASNRPILKDSPETLAAFRQDPVNEQWLKGTVQQQQQLAAQATEKMGRYEELSPEETEALRMSTSEIGLPLEVFKKDAMRYGYGREEHALLQKPARVPRAAGHTAGPKFTEAGGLNFSPEVVGGTGADGTHGLLSLASSDPILRVKADGTRQPYTATAVHQQYNLLENGKPGRLVTKNASPQELAYLKPQLHVTTKDGRVVTPTDPTLEQRYQQGDRQPLLNWVRDQREKDPTVALKWHFLAAPTKNKLTAEGGAQAIFERLQQERAATHKAPGDAGYQGDEKLRSTAQQLAAGQGASLLIPYTGASLRDIDVATNYMMRGPMRRKKMQAEYDRFERETAPRPAEQRAAPAKKSIGVDFGTTPTPKSTTQAAPAAPPFKRAGNKKTGIQF